MEVMTLGAPRSMVTNDGAAHVEPEFAIKGDSRYKEASVAPFVSAGRFDHPELALIGKLAFVVRSMALVPQEAEGAGEGWELTSAARNRTKRASPIILRDKQATTHSTDKPHTAPNTQKHSKPAEG
jgi:hypothetical protein